MFIVPLVNSSVKSQPIKKSVKGPNQKLEFTDKEVITIYVFGLMSGYKTLTNIHEFTYAHLKKLFPRLLNYSAYHHRLDELAYEIVSFADHFVKIRISLTLELKSLPILLI